METSISKLLQHTGAPLRAGMLQGHRISTSVALASAAALSGEIALTRLFSVVLSYYFVYVLLSVAVLGLGVGALLAHWQSLRSKRYISPAYALAGAAATYVFIVILFVTTLSYRWWSVYLFCSAAAFALTGWFLSRVFSQAASGSGRLYWADLTGAGLGIFAVYAALNLLGAVDTLLLAAVLFMAGALSYQWNRALTSGFVLVLLLLTVNLPTQLLHVDLARAESNKTSAIALDPNGLRGSVIYHEEDAFARVDAVAYPDFPNERTIFVDGGSGSPIFRVEGAVESVSYLRQDLGYLPFHFFAPESVYIVGPGGGKDIALALLAGSQQITAVEISRGIVQVLDKMSSYNGNLHRHPAVDLVIGEGRSYLKSQTRTYDLIYLSQVANEAADLTGLALAENYVYTQEAFLDYLAHLNPNGVVAMRLHDEPHVHRAFVTALTALVSSGLTTQQAMEQIVVIAGLPDPRAQAEMDPLLLIAASPLSPELGAELLQATQAANAFPFFIPHVREGMPYAAFSQGEIQANEFVSRLAGGYASPTTDDNPFFYLLQRELPRELRQLIVLLTIAVGSWVLYCILQQRPRALQSKARQKREQSSGYRSAQQWVYHGYFASLGAGFMLLEIALLQRFNLFLGHPVRSLIVVLGGLLLAVGVGSLLTHRYTGLDSQERIPLQVPAIVRWAALGILVLVMVYMAGLPRLLSTLHGTAQNVRILIALILITPLGVLLGIPFPLGLRMVNTQFGERDVALAWATNGLFSVVGSVLAMVLAIRYGFTWVWAACWFSYLVLGILTWKPLRQKEWT